MWISPYQPDVSKTKFILIYRKLILDMSNLFMAEYNYSCSNEDDCVVTTDISKAEESDAIIFDFVAQCYGDGEPNTVRTSPGHIAILRRRNEK